MYALNKGPYNILAKTRRGLPQKLDNLENQREHLGKKPGEAVTADMSSPRPVFHVNGRRSHMHRNHHEAITPQHEEITTYIHESWKSVNREYESTKQSTDGKVPKVVYYQDNSTNPQLVNFEPFDLELYWGERLLQNIKQST